MPKIYKHNETICLKNLINLKHKINKNTIKGTKFNIKKNELFNISKNIIGFIKNKDNILFIDEQNTYIKANSDTNSLIEIEGDYQLWNKYYHELNKIPPNLFKKIKKVRINRNQIDIILEKNITIKACKSIQDLNNFFNDFPEILQTENTVIDLRETKRVL